MVDWNIFWQGIFPGLIVLTASTLSAYFLIHRYQRRKHKKEIRDDLLQLENDVVKSMLEFYNVYEDWLIKSQNKTLSKYDKEEEIRLGVEMNKAVVNFETKVRLLCDRILLQLKIKEEYEWKSIRELRANIEVFSSEFVSTVQKKRKPIKIDLKSRFSNLLEGVSMIILTAKVKK